MNRCDQARRLFGPYWDDEATQAEREWLESHLAGCTSCQPGYEQFARTLERVGALPRIEVAADLAERALAAARRATAVPDRIIVTSAAPRWLPVTAVGLVLLLGVGALLVVFASQRGSGLLAGSEAPVAQPRLVASALPAAVAATRATLADSLFDHAGDVEFILDPVVLHRGRAQAASHLPEGAQGEQTVITF